MPQCHAVTIPLMTSLSRGVLTFKISGRKLSGEFFRSLRMRPDLLRSLVNVLYVDLANDSFAETAIDEYRSKSNEVNPGNHCGNCGGTQKGHTPCQRQDSENYYQPDPLASLREPVIRRDSHRFHLHAVTGLPLDH